MGERKCSLLKLHVAEVAFFLHLAVVPASAGACYPAIFAFGDSLTDTGNAIKTRNPLFFTTADIPYGETYFKHPALRYSDGRLLIDCLAQALALPFLNPYLAYKDQPTDFSHGVNYAVAGATVQGSGVALSNGGFNGLTVQNFDAQLLWHLNVKNLSSKPPPSGVQFPGPDAFSEGVYYIEIGGNDYSSIFVRDHYFPKRDRTPITISKALQLVPTIVGKLVDGIELLYANEARNFILVSIPPLGCAPAYLRAFNGTKDSYGCLEVSNEIARVHNQQLTTALQSLRLKYSDINIIYADKYTVYENVVENPSAYGFTEAINTCCGAGPGTPYGFQLIDICSRGTYVCPDPLSYVIWDGIHSTDAFNRLVANQFVSGTHIYPSNGFFACATEVAR